MLWAAADQDAIESHRYADSVLGPRFHAAYNDWAYQHPAKPDHARGLDAGDVKRWRLARNAFKELDSAYKRAGYE
jgi:hypothetical protein